MVGILLPTSVRPSKTKDFRIKYKRVTLWIEAPAISLVFMSEMLRNYNKANSHQYSLLRFPSFSITVRFWVKKSRFSPCVTYLWSLRTFLSRCKQFCNVEIIESASDVANDREAVCKIIFFIKNAFFKYQGLLTVITVNDNYTERQMLTC